MLKDSAQEFLAMNAPVEQFRTLRDDNYTPFDQDLWREIVEMGWTALTIPEEYNGLDFGFVGLGQVLEEMGKNLTKLLYSFHCPWWNCPSQFYQFQTQRVWIPEIMNGNKRIALDKTKLPTLILVK